MRRPGARTLGRAGRVGPSGWGGVLDALINVHCFPPAHLLLLKPGICTSIRICLAGPAKTSAAHKWLRLRAWARLPVCWASGGSRPAGLGGATCKWQRRAAPLATASASRRSESRTEVAWAASSTACRRGCKSPRWGACRRQRRPPPVRPWSPRLSILSGLHSSSVYRLLPERGCGPAGGDPV